METAKEGGELDPEKGPEVQFARFVSGELVLFTACTSELEYIAVSHVFGKTEWHSIPGIKNEVLASPQKAAFIEKELPALIGDLPFWMDILTVNQRIQAEVISVVGAIPWIFRNAVQTLAIREDDGIYPCCGKVLKGVKNSKKFAETLTNHYSDHMYDVCDESYLQRLWTFQECLLSHSIRFVVCHRDDHLKKEKRGIGDLYKYETDIRRVQELLWVLGYCFRSNGGKEVSECDFADAYVHGKTVTRSKPRRPTVTEDIHTGCFAGINLASRRVASEPRDYIYATMPPFPWYKYPTNAENMAFGEIFLDLYNQAAEKRHPFVPKFTASMIQSSAADVSKAWRPSKQQPEPECLGDFLKLLGQPLATDTPDNDSCCHATTYVRVLAFEGSTHFEVLPMIQSATKFSKEIWMVCHVAGELSKYGSNPDSAWEMDITDATYLGCSPISEKSIDPCPSAIEDEDPRIIIERPCVEFATTPAEIGKTFRWSTVDHHVDYVPILEHSRSILDAAWYAWNSEYLHTHQKTRFKKFQHEMESRWSKELLHTLTLLTAMVNCQIGLSAARWVRKYFVPALIQYDKDNVVLGLLAKHARPVKKHEIKLMMSVVRHLQGPSLGKDLVLVDLAAPSAPVGIIPDFYYGFERGAEWEKRMKVLYDGLGRVVAPGKLEYTSMSPETCAATIRKRMQEDAGNEEE